MPNEIIIRMTISREIKNTPSYHNRKKLYLYKILCDLAVADTAHVKCFRITADITHTKCFRISEPNHIGTLHLVHRKIPIIQD